MTASGNEMENKTEGGTLLCFIAKTKYFQFFHDENIYRLIFLENLYIVHLIVSVYVMRSLISDCVGYYS